MLICSALLSVISLLDLVSTSTDSDADISVRCPAHCRCTPSQQTVDCSSRQLTELADIIDSIDPATRVLDLRRNQFSTIRPRQFSRLTNVSVILLDNNAIDDIQPHAFQGLVNIRSISLTRNRLVTIHSNAFSEVSGEEAHCEHSTLNEATLCTIDLSHNPIELVEKNAFAWLQRLQVKLGHSDVAMTLGAYAFYGARAIPRVLVGRVPALTLKPRLFTNTEELVSVEIADTTIAQLRMFVFEGLKNVEKIKFANVSVDGIESFAFSGIHFKRRPANGRNEHVLSEDLRNAGVGNNNNKRRKLRRQRFAQSGGRINFSSCRLQHINTDSFRDTNVAHIEISNSQIGRIDKQAFQAVDGLQSLSISGNRFETKRLVTDSFGSLRGLRSLYFADNDFDVVEPFAFRDVIDVDVFSIRVGSPDIRLMTEAFSHVSDVGLLSLSGGMTSASGNGGHASLVIDVGVFRNLVSVDDLRIENFLFPVVKRHSFVGLSRIHNLTIANCNVTAIEKEAFGDSASHAGMVEQFDIGSGNQLNCDCSSGTILRELELRFNQFTAQCRVGVGSTETFVELRQMALQQPNAVCGAVSRVIPSLFYSALSAFVAFLCRRSAT